MYICLCNGITDSQIDQAVDNGASNFNDIQSELNIATSCGQCACEAKRVLSQRIEERHLALQGAATVACDAVNLDIYAVAK